MGNSIDHTDFYGAMVPQYGYEKKINGFMTCTMQV